jgi:hypothetical protein
VRRRKSVLAYATLSAALVEKHRLAEHGRLVHRGELVNDSPERNDARDFGLIR